MAKKKRSPRKMRPTRQSAKPSKERAEPIAKYNPIEPEIDSESEGSESIEPSIRLIRIEPLEIAGLTRQDDESYIMVDPSAEIELRHFKGMLTLGSLANIDINTPGNAEVIVTAMEKCTDFLSLSVVDWRWLDRRGEPIDLSPFDDPDAFIGLSMAELTWMLEAVSGVVKEGAASKNS